MNVVSCVTGEAKAHVELVAAQIFKMIFSSKHLVNTVRYINTDVKKSQLITLFYQLC